MIGIAIIMYFGALIIPAVYLLSTRWRGAARRPMIIGAGIQIFCSLAVWVFVCLLWRAGYKEFYWGWAFILPINAVGLIYFLTILFIYERRSREQK
jgi:hypothetical protein